MLKLEQRTKEYHYTSEMLKKGQVHIKFPDIIYKRKAFHSPLELFAYYFRLKGESFQQIQVLKVITYFMEDLQDAKVNFNNPLSYFPLYVLENRRLMRWTEERTFTLNRTGKKWLESMKETIELYEKEQNEIERSVE